MGVYVDVDDFKKTLALEGTTFADEDIELAIQAASAAIDGYKGMRFYPTEETRYYTARPYDTYIAIDDLIGLGTEDTPGTTITVDTNGDGSYDTTWTVGTDFDLDPANAVIGGHPYRRLVLRSLANRSFPTYGRSIKVTGVFGWSEPPAQVRQAAVILTNRLLKRARETPFGILALGQDIGATARLGRLDPDVAFLLDSIPGGRVALFV